jgi:hypothetical protein
MLFDMRSPGRQLAVKVIYGGLAILLGGGLILFGVGSGVSGGGLFDALSGNSGSLPDNAFVKKADQQQKFVVTHPKDAEAYAQLARLRFQSAGFDDKKGVFTTDGLKQLRLSDQAWQRHLKLAGNKPNLRVANVMLNVYDPNALNEPAKGADAMQLIIDDAGSSATARQYAQLAYFAYLGQDARLGKLAGDKAVALAPKDDREQFKSVIASYKAAGKQAATQTTTTPTTQP